jgi:hypothetical protein
MAAGTRRVDEKWMTTTRKAKESPWLRGENGSKWRVLSQGNRRRLAGF